MKTLTLSLLLCLLATAQAQTPPAQPKNDQPATQQVRSTEPFYFRLEPDRTQPAETFCAYMRTYRVKRQYRDTDVVAPAGYTTCVPSQRFELHSAVQVETDRAHRRTTRP